MRIHPALIVGLAHIACSSSDGGADGSGATGGASGSAGVAGAGGTTSTGGASGSAGLAGSSSGGSAGGGAAPQLPGIDDPIALVLQGTFGTGARSLTGTYATNCNQDDSARRAEISQDLAASWEYPAASGPVAEDDWAFVLLDPHDLTQVWWAGSNQFAAQSEIEGTVHEIEATATRLRVNMEGRVSLMAPNDTPANFRFWVIGTCNWQ